MKNELKDVTDQKALKERIDKMSRRLGKNPKTIERALTKKEDGIPTSRYIIVFTIIGVILASYFVALAQM